MNTLIQIFQDLDYPTVLDIASEYYFHTRQQLSKNEFDKQFAKYIESKGHTEEVIARYKLDPNKSNPEAERNIQLFNFQIKKKHAMIEGFESNTTILNTSETGTGKTYATLSVCETDKRPLICICPKAVLLNWYLLAMRNEIEVLAICNYETFINGKMYSFSNKDDVDNLPRIDNPYMKRVEKYHGARKKVEFVWNNLPERTNIVFDEAHYCKNLTAQRTKLLLSAYDYANHPENRWKKIKITLLSATIIETPKNLMPFMYVLGYAKIPNDKSRISDPKFSIKEFGYRLLAEKKMTRTTMKEARIAMNDIHKSDVKTKIFKLKEEDRAQIQTLCEEVRNILTNAEKGKSSSSHLAVRLRCRQEIEGLKVGVLVSEMEKQLLAGFSVGIFVNFLETHRAIRTVLREKFSQHKFSSIIGGQTAFERLKELEAFQKGQNRIIVAMTGAGGVGIGMHDVYGNYRRYGLISPPESATQTVQCIGRMDRIGTKSDSIQRIIFIAGTIEEKIAENLTKKMKAIGDVNCAEDVDNIFLYDKVHDYEAVKAETKAYDNNIAGQIKIKKSKARGVVIIHIPNYMIDAFESGIPPECRVTMKINKGAYEFKLDQLPIIKEYLQRLT